MRRHHRTVLAALAACGALAIATPALAQNNQGSMDALEERRDELTLELGRLDTLLETQALEITEIEDGIETRTIEVELVADDIEWTVFSRREPATTRVEMAIVGFTQGDPRRNALLNEILTLEGDDEPSRRRALYGSVIDDSIDRLAEIDGHLLALREDLDEARTRLTDTEAALAAAEEVRVLTGILRSEAADELAATLQDIERLRALGARAVLTGALAFDDPTRPALAVKIDNVPGARPQAGINQADIVYVEEVEGGLTRLAAVFHSQGAEAVGPIRSMRTGDFGLLAQFNGPLFSNSGGNRGARSQLASSTLIDVGVDAQEDIYYRDRSRSAPHNLFSNAFNLWSVGRDAEGAGVPQPLFLFRGADADLPSTATPVSTVTTDYGSTEVTYSWNGTGWDRFQDGGPTIDADGVATAPTTVVVQFVDYIPSSADGRSPEAVTTGEGAAWILTDGHLVQAVWVRATVTDQTKFRSPTSGNEIPILPGPIWIELPRPDRATAS